jgi:hypothetical protein
VLLDHFNVGQMRERCVPIAQETAEALLSKAMKSLSVLGHKKHAFIYIKLDDMSYNNIKSMVIGNYEIEQTLRLSNEKRKRKKRREMWY